MARRVISLIGPATGPRESGVPSGHLAKHFRTAQGSQDATPIFFQDGSVATLRADAVVPAK